MARFADTIVKWSPPEEASIFVTGSILESVPKGWSGLIAGSGKLLESTTLKLTNATILGLRGPLSAKGLKGDFVLGDPGLLADELVTVEKKYTLGIVPHWSDSTLEHRFQEWNPFIIRPEGNPLKVIHDIGRCRKIVSSSLHGIILADAFGIPRRIEISGANFTKEGNDFKFRDHNAAIGLKHLIGVTQEAPRYNVQDRQSELYDMFRNLGRRLMGESR